MTAGSSGDRGRIPRGVAIGLNLLASAVLAMLVFQCARLAYWNAFTSFQIWDDEGYFLLALREFREHGGLYEGIQGVFYGPFYFQSIVALSWITRLQLDTENARWLMLLGWFVGLASTGLVAWRLTRSLLAPLLLISLGFPFLFFFTNEPLHATSVVLLLLAPVLLLLTGPLDEGPAPRPLAWATCGALCAALFLVKANLGLYFVLGLAVTFAAHAGGRAGSWFRVVLGLAILLLPLAQMRQLLELESVQDYALLITLALVPFVIAMFRARERAPRGRESLYALGGFTVVSVASIGVSLFTGSTAAGMWRALVEAALEFPLKNHYPPDLPARGVILLGAVAIPVRLSLRSGSAAASVVRLAASLFVLQECVRVQVPFASLPFVWIASSGGRDSRARDALGILTVLSALQAFPIPGCQVGLFSLLAVLVGTIGLFDALRDFSWIASVPWYLRVPAGAACLVGVGLHLDAHHPAWRAVQMYRDRWELGVPLDLPGTGPLRLSELETSRFRWLAANLRENADTFVGVPGMHSLHLWSEVPPPVPFYKHHWVLFRDGAEEEALARSLTEGPRRCAIHNAGLVGFWLHDTLREGPVRSALQALFASAGDAGEYRLLLPRNQPRRMVLNAMPADGFAELRERYDASRLFALTLPPLGDARVARMTVVNTTSGIEIFDTELPPTRRLVVLDEAQQELLCAPDRRIPDTHGVSRLLVLWPRIEQQLDVQELLVRVYDEQGRVVARCLIQGLNIGK
ncbi:MAG: hypothetical protein NTY35_10605 [Planctomycetota bacterium]|nr:hypothetical protein [Planctomycetota bacterium]